MVLNIMFKLFLHYILLFGGHTKYKPIKSIISANSASLKSWTSRFTRSLLYLLSATHTTLTIPPPPKITSSLWLYTVLLLIENMQELSAKVSFISG